MVKILEVERTLGFILKKQREVIAAFVKENDVFAVLSTGFGKHYRSVLIMQPTASSTFLRVLDSNISSLYSAETQKRHSSNISTIIITQ